MRKNGKLTLIRSHAFRSLILLLTLLLLLFSCSSEKDKRQTIVKEYGEPDEIVTSSFGTYKTELYVYKRKDTNRAYEFQKTASGCGGSGQWYVYRVYYADYLGYELYMPPQITHAPIQSAPQGEKLSVSAEVIDDEIVVSVTLYFREVGQEEFQSIRMTPDENKYSANIPIQAVTAAGIEYYIEAEDEEHTSQLPENGVYTITVSSAGKVVVKAPVETSPGYFQPPTLPAPGDMSNDLSPVSP